MNFPTISAHDVPVATAAEMAEADRAAVQRGISLETLMENASRQIAAVAEAMLDDIDSCVIAAVVGTGNNGGDALGALRILAERDIVVDAYLSGPPDRLRPLARAQYDRLVALDVPLYDATAQRDGFVRHRLEARNLVIDGLLGYSAKGAPRGMIASLIDAANAAKKPILAVDIPSGLDPDDGTAPGSVIRATATVTLGLPKTGLLRPDAAELVGELILADIGLSAQPVFARGPLLRIIR